MLIKLFLAVLFVLCLYVFMSNLKEERENDKVVDKRIGKEEIKEYIEKTFGKGKAEIYKSRLDLDGKLTHLVFIPHYEWSKTSTFEWFEVFANQNGYKHERLEQPY